MFNSNIRCIEIINGVELSGNVTSLIVTLDVLKLTTMKDKLSEKLFNSNIRCIEILNSLLITLSFMLFNSNIRCIEMMQSITDKNNAVSV